MSCCERRAGQAAAARGSILYSLLNRGALCPQRQLQSPAAPPVALRAPQLVHEAASEVLAKTFKFVKNVPCFRGLPEGDQLRLVRNSWAPLLVLGMAQECVDLDTVETRQPSLLHRILTRSEERQAPVGDAAGIKEFLWRCRGLRISVKEQVFLKGALLFSPEVTQLECREYIRALHREAVRALYEHVRAAHRGHAERFGRLRAVLRALRSVDQDAVAGLFLGPGTGTSSIEERVLAMFYGRK